MLRSRSTTYLVKRWVYAPYGKGNLLLLVMLAILAFVPLDLHTDNDGLAAYGKPFEVAQTIAVFTKWSFPHLRHCF